ncbi:MAG: Mov34/MPN/PAD-1 family protein [Burkholderiaceae bacterium]
MKWTDQSPTDEPAVLTDAVLNQPALRFLCGSPGTSNCQVLIPQHIHHQVLTHLRSADIEQGGLLIGIPYVNPVEHQSHPPSAITGGDKTNKENRVVPSHIDVLSAIAAPMSSGTGYSLRMEASVWGAANSALVQLGQNDARIVGWYHSHPGLGAFFSPTDRSTQAAFFRHPYSVGWVIDPTDDSHAIFRGPDSQAACAIII